MAIITTYGDEKTTLPREVLVSISKNAKIYISIVLLENAIIETSSFIIDKSLITMDGGTTAGVF